MGLPPHRSDFSHSLALELTPLRVEQDQGHFEGWKRLDHVPDLSGRRSSAAGRWAPKLTTL